MRRSAAAITALLGGAGVALTAGLIALVATTLTYAPIVRAATPMAVRVPLACTKGPSGQAWQAIVSVPATQVSGARYTLRVDGVSSGAISQTGLRYLHDVAFDLVVPAGTTYVDGTARIVPNTGTANVQSGARAWHDAGAIHVQLPGHVESGTSYTPPSVEFDVLATAPAGSVARLQLAEYRVVAKAFLVGDVHVRCDPTPKPYTIGATTLTAP